MSNKISIRKANIGDDKVLAELERSCFPEAEAADRDTFIKRLESYSEQFLVIEVLDEETKDSGKVIGLVNGPITKEENLTDEMYADTGFHDINGSWKMIFGVETHPDFQHQGIASLAMRACIEQAKEEGRKGLVLTCKKELIGFYERFGFQNEGISGSVHGGAVWYQMRLSF